MPVIQALKKPEVYLKVKRNYSFYFQMASLMETLMLGMVRRWEVEERMAAALERLMRWIEVMGLESDREVLEKSEFIEGEE